jgi:hypothetical protein
MTPEQMDAHAAAGNQAIDWMSRLDTDSKREATVRWFGTAWGAPVCDQALHIPTPVGEQCMGGCNERITETDRGISTPLAGLENTGRTRAYFHLHCFLEITVAPIHEPYRRGIEPS